jgi:hypothetical protein
MEVKMETASAPQLTNRKWFDIWWDVWSHPGSDVFRRMLQESDAGYVRGFKWVASMAVIGAVLSSLISGIFLQRIAPAASAGMLTTLVCGVIAAPVAAVIGMTISAAIYHGIAKLFGGNGLWGQLVFCFSAIQAPLYLVSALLSLLSSTISVYSLTSQGSTAFAQPMSSLPICLAIPSLILSIYSLVLFASAIKAVENLDTGRSVLTVFIPVIVVILLMVCVGLFLLPAFSTTR